MNAPEGEVPYAPGEITGPDPLSRKIEKEKPIVRSSSTEGEPEGDDEMTNDKPDLPPAMPPLS